MVNEEGEKLKCSTREFYGDAKYKYSNAKIKRWYDKSPEVLEAIRNMPTKKTSESTKFLAYVHYMLPRLDMLLVYHMRQGFRGLKFKRYISAQKKLHSLCKAITRRVGCKTVVGFGDWSNKDSGGIIKGSPSGPVKRLERELRKHCRVVSMDEVQDQQAALRLQDAAAQPVFGEAVQGWGEKRPPPMATRTRRKKISPPVDMYAFKRAPGVRKRLQMRKKGTSDPSRPLPFSLTGFDNRVYEQARTFVETLDDPGDVPPQITVGVYPNGVPVEFNDLQTLHNGEIISDAIVDGMCKLINNKDDCIAYPSIVYTMATHGQIGPLLNRNHESVWKDGNDDRTRTRKLAPYNFRSIAELVSQPNMRGVRYVFMSINLANYHWVLVAYDVLNSRLNS
ncbi:hypothetical protein KFL_006700050 [Klebsormidium nitens]|uniref:Uncharacterized protein n=1 Tax=Klebsormidium nitens TaxID=105231 RepID=A0A1Y1IPW3_KLENI|nr:hypothetical protein KFL_006700050 [Klebsormidium nitens]|eukprot:GAQ90667.1 hypothetical protein KFL_006700050 [Klebsormidium nitens]